MRAALVACLLVAASAGAARADQRADAQAAMTSYFAGEQRGGVVLLGMGTVGVVAGGLLYRHDTAWSRGAAYPLLAVGALHAIAGVFVYVASGRRVDRFAAQIDDDPDRFVTGERARMRGVARTFTALKIAEGVLIAGGLGAAAYGWRRDRATWTGAGAAVAAEAALTLVFDVVAARRADRYRAALARITLMNARDPGGRATTTLLGYGAAF